MAPTKSKFERLCDAKVLIAKQFSVQDIEKVERITDEEVEALIRLHKSIGPATPGKEHMMPNIGV